jgi:hypothetical protein
VLGSFLKPQIPPLNVDPLASGTVCQRANQPDKRRLPVLSERDARAATITFSAASPTIARSTRSSSLLQRRRMFAALRRSTARPTAQRCIDAANSRPLKENNGPVAPFAELHEAAFFERPRQ